jgi:predicted hydrocarbon binding protein
MRLSCSGAWSADAPDRPLPPNPYMMSDPSSGQLLGIGSATLRAMRDAILEQEDAAETLRNAGYASGSDAYSSMQSWAREEEGRDASYAPTEEFLQVMSNYFETLGWGRFAVSRLKEAAAIVDVDNCWEARNPGGLNLGCHITTGLLVGFFENVAGFPVAAMEVECAARGASCCRFLIGNIELLDYLHEGIQRGDGYESLAAQVPGD